MAGNDFLLGFGGNDVIDGGDDNDTVAGGDGDDMLLGGSGDDSLSGDDLFGIFGEDTLTGGVGADAFSWSVSSSEGSQSSTSVIQDVITDFAGAGAAGGDTLELVQPFGEPHRLTFRGALPTLPAIGSALAFGNQ